MTTVFQSASKQSTVQLWTDESAKEFAVRLSSDEQGSFRSASNLSCDYSYLALEIEMGKMNTKGWNFMLEFLSREWLQNAKKVTVLSEGSLALTGSSLQNEIASQAHANSSTHISLKEENPVLARARKAGEKRVRPRLQCHFCRLRYFRDEERVAHEKMW